MTSSGTTGSQDRNKKQVISRLCFTMNNVYNIENNIENNTGGY